MKKTFKILLFISLLFIGKVGAAPANTAFTDDNFYECIISKLNTDGYNSVYDRDSNTYKVTDAELKSITVLKCNEANITSVSGLGLMTELTDLNLSDNNISSIELTKNTKIKNLLLSNNGISSIDLTKNTNLENLYLDGNNISSLNLTNNTNLLVLNINKNKISSLDLTKNTKLMDLKATENAIVSQSKAVFKGSTLNLTLPIKFPAESEWSNTSWITKDANIAGVNQKGSVNALKSGTVNIIGSYSDIYNVAFNITVAEISSEVYNIDDVAGTIAVNDSSISTILNNITVTNGEAMIYNASDKYVTSGKITQTGFKLKVMQSATILKTYSLTLVETVANNDLKTLEVKDYAIDFDKDKTNYTIIVENDVTRVEVKAEAEEKDAKVEITGNEELVEGSNTVTITVTGNDDTTKTYTINVIKQGDSNANQDSKANVYLEKLEVKGYELNFKEKVDYYDLKIEDDAESLEITATPVDSQAKVEIKGNHNLKNNSKIEIVVTSTDGSTRTYTINVIKNDRGLIRLVVIILALLALLLATVLCIILIKKHNDKKKDDNNNDDIEKTKEVKVLSDSNNIAFIENTKITDNENSEIHEQKTIKFRRICKRCGAVNTLTNDNCYLCGEHLEDGAE